MSQPHFRIGRTVGMSLAVVSALGAVAGCGSGDTTSSDDKKAAKIAFLASSYTDYAQAEVRGLKSVVEPKGGSVTAFNANFDAAKQSQQCRDVIQSGKYNAIVLTPATTTTAAPCVNPAKAAGIPVVALESPIGPDSNTLEPQLDGVVGSVVSTTDYFAASVVAVTRAACEGRNPCEIIYEAVMPGSDPLADTTKKQIATIPNARIVQDVIGMFDPATLAKNLPDVLARNPDADVFLASADSQALAAVPAIKKAGMLGDIRIIGNGGSRLGVAAIKAGTIFASNGSWPQTTGEAAGRMVIQAINGEPVKPNAVNALAVGEPRILTADNVDSFTPQWGAAPQ